MHQGGGRNTINPSLRKYIPSIDNGCLVKPMYRGRFSDIIGNISFEEFIHILKDIKIEELDRHLAPQSNLYAFCDENLNSHISLGEKENFSDFYFNTENVNSEITDLLTILSISGEEYNFFLENYNSNKTIVGGKNNKDIPELYKFKRKQIIDLEHMPENHYDYFLNDEIKNTIYNYYLKDFVWIDKLKNRIIDTSAGLTF